MSFSVVTRHYDNEHSFVLYNPWFGLALDSRFNDFLHSSRLRTRIQQESEIQFPTLWRKFVTNSYEYQKLVDNLNAEADKGINRVNQATERKVSQLMENGSLEPIKTSIFDAAMQKYGLFQQGLSAKSDAADAARNQRLVDAENKIKSLEDGQWYTFLGGAIIGTGLGVFACKK